MIKIEKNYILIIFTILFTLMNSCKDLDELNINPNGVDPDVADLNLLMPTFITNVGQNVVNLGFGDIAGVMQHTQKDGWTGSHNSYEWTNNSHSWGGYYGILRNVDEFHQKAVKNNYEFHEGVALVMKAYVFGLIADLWGDAPLTDALKADLGEEYFKPVFDPQKDIYLSILNDLKDANIFLSKDKAIYENISATQDVLYKGNVAKWRKFANSLALRYYMRLAAKEPEIAKKGIQDIITQSNDFPLITHFSDDANIGYIGSSPGDSWPSTMEFEPNPSGDYMRLKMCSTLVKALQKLNDPRLGVWANKIEIPLVLVEGEKIDRIVDLDDDRKIREISQDIVDHYEENIHTSIDFDTEYIGIPPSLSGATLYNLNPNEGQGLYNPHCSQLSDIYKESFGPLLQMRLMSAAEVHFILAEAASYEWIPEDPETHYEAGIQQSFNAWGVGDKFKDYIEGATYTGLESIIQQKWIASWTTAAEAWFDWRRTGLPDLKVGEVPKREALPLRFYYHFDNEISKNTANANAAIDKLEPTEFKGTDSNNSAWSKTWILQGTGKPY